MKILITGAHGFLGWHVCKELRVTGHELLTPSRRELDLLDTQRYGDGEHVTNIVATYLRMNKINAIVHLAGNVGGIGYNKDNQGKLGYENLQMGLNILEGARNAEVKKLVILGTTCSYPHTPKTIPFIEDELFDGMPEITNSGYGIAKRTLIKLATEYSKQYRMNVTNLIPTNLVGEHDNFNDNSSHVIPALIKKFESPRHRTRWVLRKNGDMCVINNSLEVPETYVQLWGTGLASRDFLYAGDCARAIAIALMENTGPDPINLGSGKEITIVDLAQIIKRVGNYDAEIVWDRSKPDGQPRRYLDITRAKNILNWEPMVSLEESIRRTIDWYRENE